jgi:hypothetical protein
MDVLQNPKKQHESLRNNFYHLKKYNLQSQSLTKVKLPRSAINYSITYKVSHYNGKIQLLTMVKFQSFTMVKFQSFTMVKFQSFTMVKFQSFTMVKFQSLRLWQLTRSTDIFRSLKRIQLLGDLPSTQE